MQAQIDSLMARSYSLDPDSATVLQKVSLETSWLKTTLYGMDKFVRSSFVNQDNLLKTHSELVRTQGEVMTGQFTEVGSKLESVGIQTADMATFLHDKEEAEEAAKKKKAPPKKKK